MVFRNKEEIPEQHSLFSFEHNSERQDYHTMTEGSGDLDS